MEIRQNELYKRYKLSSADKAQVCDGGSWEDLRSTAEANSTADELVNGLSYRPSRRKSLSGRRASRETDASYEEKQQDAPSSSFLPTASFTSDDGSMGFLDLSEKMDGSEISKASAASNRSKERRPSLPASTSTTKVPASKSRRSSDSDTSKNVVMRKLSRPMHRSMSSNTLSGIMRPSRYSSNNLAAMNSIGESGRITSCMNLNTLHDKPFEKEKLPRSTSATWVAHGVEFSKSMEVYVFKK